MAIFGASRNRLLLAGVAGLGLSGCMVGPNFHPPRAAVPPSYLAEGQAKQAPPYVSGDAVDPAWWQSFGDPELTRLETTAVAQNLDLQIATQRLLEAEAQAQIEGAVLYPDVSGAASYTREGPSKKGIFNAFGGAAAASTDAGTTADGADTAIGGGAFPAATIAPIDLYQYGLQSMYDLDLWGKNRRAVEAAVAAARASEEARRAGLLNVQAQVASDYIRLRGAETVLDITKQNLGFANALIRLTVEREQAGLTTALDVANAKATAAQIDSRIPTLIAERDGMIEQISLLLGVTPDGLPAALLDDSPVPLTPPTVPVGMPADLLRRRPDVREAEQNLHQATAEVGVATAAFFPDVSLSASVSLQALQFKNLNGLEALTYAFGPDISIPLFAGGQLNGQLKLEQARQQEAAISYAKTVLTAFTQVNAALVDYSEEHDVLAALTVDVQQSQIAQNLAEEQYKEGLADYLSVLDAQQDNLTAQVNRAEALQTMATDLVTLYQALGGGWQQLFPADQQAALSGPFSPAGTPVEQPPPVAAGTQAMPDGLQR